MLNKLLTTLTLLTVVACTPIPVMADEGAVVKCERHAERASLAMKFRQDGVSLRDTLNVLGTSKERKKWIKIAYRKPVMSSEKYKALQIEKFKNDIMFECLDKEGY